MAAPCPTRLHVRGVSLNRYNDRTKAVLPVLRGIDFEVHEGEIVCIVGPSGCGKTTLLNLVDGLIRATAGSILVNGHVIAGPGPDRAMVFQHDSLFPWRTVLQNVMYGLDLQGKLGKPERTERARALVMSPELLLLDEPFAALDAQTREFMQVELLKILARARTTALFVTHQINEAVFLSNRVVVFSARPAGVKEIIAIDLPPARTLAMKHQAPFLALEERIWRLIEQEAEQTGMLTVA